MTKVQRVKRKHVAAMLMKIAQAYGQGKYDVRRGAIDWDTYTWPKQFAMAIRFPENLPSTDGLKISTMRIAVACRVPTGARPEIDDAQLDDMEEDAFVIVNALSEAQMPNGDTIASVEFDGSVEWSDINYKVQGYNIQFGIVF